MARARGDPGHNAPEPHKTNPIAGTQVRTCDSHTRFHRTSQRRTTRVELKVYVRIKDNQNILIAI
jgi:hypothetical protein